MPQPLQCRLAWHAQTRIVVATLNDELCGIDRAPHHADQTLQRAWTRLTESRLSNLKYNCGLTLRTHWLAAERTRVGQPDAWLQQLVQSSYAQRSDLDLQPGVLPDYPAGCLFQQLAESRYKGLPFAVPPPSKCTSQRSLSTQVRSVVLKLALEE